MQKAKARKQKLPPGLLRREHAAAYAGVSVACWDRWTAIGLNPEPRKIGGAVLWSRHELAAWAKRGCPPRDEWGPLWRAILSRR